MKPQGVAQKPKTSRTTRPKDPRVEKEYYKEIEFTCPIRGKVKQKVKITRYKPFGQMPDIKKVRVEDQSQMIDDLDDGLNIYADKDSSNGSEETN